LPKKAEPKKKRQQRANVQQRARTMPLTSQTVNLPKETSLARVIHYSRNKLKSGILLPIMPILIRLEGFLTVSMRSLLTRNKVQGIESQQQKSTLTGCLASLYSRLRTKQSKAFIPLLILSLMLSSLPMSNIRAKVVALRHQVTYANSMEKFQAMVGGFGSGKSQASVFRTLHLAKVRDKCVMLQVAPTYSLLSDVNIPDYEDILSKYRIKYDYNKQNKKIVFNQGSLNAEVWFRSADRPERIVGFDVTDFQIDEYDILTPSKQKELWRKIIARARGCDNTTGGVTTTPEGFRETYELFEKNKIGPLTRAKTTDNIFLPQDYIDTLYDQYDEQLVKQYINGEFVNINGMQAYYSFSRDKNHLSNSDFEKLFERSIAESPIISIGMDFNVKKMCAECFIHVSDKRHIHFFDEIILPHPTNSDITQTQKMCDIIKDKFSGKQINVYPDASGRHRETSSIDSDIAILEKNDFRVYANRSNPSVRDRLNATNTMLGKSRITVDTARCTDLTEDCDKCERDKYGDIDKKDEDRTHSSDAGSYAVVYLYPINHGRMVRHEI